MTSFEKAMATFVYNEGWKYHLATVSDKPYSVKLTARKDGLAVTFDATFGSSDSPNPLDGKLNVPPGESLEKLKNKKLVLECDGRKVVTHSFATKRGTWKVCNVSPEENTRLQGFLQAEPECPD